MGMFLCACYCNTQLSTGLLPLRVRAKVPTMGISTLGVAIPIHNIPEGIAVSVPIYFATGDRKRHSK